MKELRRENPRFPYDRQYRAIGWKVLLETTTTFDNDANQALFAPTQEPLNLFGRLIDDTTIRTIGHTAFHNPADLGQELLGMTKRKSRHFDFALNTVMMKHKKSGYGKEPNPDMMRAASLFYSGRSNSARLIEEFDLDRFDEFMIGPPFHMVNHMTDVLGQALADDETTNFQIRNIINDVLERSVLYAGMWDEDRMLGTDSLAISLHGLRSQTPLSFAQQPPEQPDRLPASA